METITDQDPMDLNELPDEEHLDSEQDPREVEDDEAVLEAENDKERTHKSQTRKKYLNKENL